MSLRHCICACNILQCCALISSGRSFSGAKKRTGIISPYALFDSNHEQKLISSDSNKVLNVSRRQAITTSAVALVATCSFAATNIKIDSRQSSDLEGIKLGRTEWVPLSNLRRPPAAVIPVSFSTYASRILINYDESVQAWWVKNQDRVRLLSEKEQEHYMEALFGSLSFSVETACARFVLDHGRSNTIDEAQSISQAFEDLAHIFLERYNGKADLLRQVGILFSQLPVQYQPQELLSELQEAVNKSTRTSSNSSATSVNDFPRFSTIDDIYHSSFSDLLSPSFSFKSEIISGASVYAVTSGRQNSKTDDNTYSGAIFEPYSALTPLTRQPPNFGIDIYALLALSGGLACTLTHSAVIPLDVVKTRLQTTDGGERTEKINLHPGGELLEEASAIIKEEGLSALFLGSQATIAGYLWYGITVYPAYFFLKLWIVSLLEPCVALSQENTIAFIAGALAAVIASIGLTPAEACRIRTVADPTTFKRLGLLGTAQYISNENPVLQWRTLFGGFNSLLLRQVIFGSIKFLAFERSCDFIYSNIPSLMSDITTPTRLLVSLIAGGFAGTFSSIISQPADSVLTYVAQKGESLGPMEACKLMIKEDGLGSLFRGLQTRCVWAGGIIAGQFLLYDLFRNIFGVDERLSEAFQLVIS